MLPSFIPLSKKKLGDEKFYDKDYIVKIYALFSNTSITTHNTHFSSLSLLHFRLPHNIGEDGVKKGSVRNRHHISRQKGLSTAT